jgi:hypothetical protein
VTDVRAVGATPEELPFPVEWQLPGGGPPVSDSDLNNAVRLFGPARPDREDERLGPL